MIAPDNRANGCPERGPEGAHGQGVRTLDSDDSVSYY